MTEPTVVHNTFVIERSYPKAPEKVFAAFSDPAKKRRWFGEGDHHELQQFEMDFRVGGVEKARYLMKAETPIAGAVLTNMGTYQDIVPNRRIVTASTMAIGDHTFSAALVTIELVATKDGTDLICTHQAAFFEGADGPKMREAGWRKLFERLGEELG